MHSGLSFLFIQGGAALGGYSKTGDPVSLCAGFAFIIAAVAWDLSKRRQPRVPLAKEWIDG